MGLIGMAQVIATIAYGIQGLRRGETTWDWPKFNANPEQENREQMQRWSLNTVPSWSYPPLAIANKYHDHQTNQPKSVRYRLILVRASDLDWLRRDRLQDLQAHVTAGHRWIPEQQLPYHEIILYAYAADRTNRPTYVCLPSGLYNARTGRVLAQAGPEQEITPLPGIYFFDGWRVRPTLVIPANLPSTKEAPVWDVEASAHSPASAEPPRSPEEEARDILATAAKNQTEDGPSTRRAAIRASVHSRNIEFLESGELATKSWNISVFSSSMVNPCSNGAPCIPNDVGTFHAIFPWHETDWNHRIPRIERWEVSRMGLTQTYATLLIAKHVF